VLQLANRDDSRDHRVSALMTAESVIVALMFAYAPTVNPTLVSWMKEGGSPVTTVWAGLVIYTLILTGFRSIHLLFKSMDMHDHSDENYRAGYYLFLVVIVVSSAYVLSNAISILHYAQCGASVDFQKVGLPNELLIWVPAPILSFWLLLVWIYPWPLTRCVRRRAEDLRRRVTLQVLVGGLIGASATLWVLVITLCLL